MKHNFTERRRIDYMDSEQSAIRSRRIAMLIDGDNAQPSLIGDMLAETSNTAQ